MPRDVGPGVTIGRWGVAVRTTKDDYFDAGMKLLASGGVPAVTIANLCDSLGVTKGSFYHHFTNVDQYRMELFTHWATERQRQVAAQLARVDDPLARLEALRRHGLLVNHEAEAAIRIWSRQDAATSKLQDRVDAERERAVREAYRDIGVPDRVASLLAELAVIVMVGAQLRGGPVDRDRLEWMYGWLHEQALALAPDGTPQP